MSARLSPFESIMWRAGQDPTRRLAVGVLVVLDRAPSEAELLARLSRLVERTPRLQWRPDDPTYARIRPMWVEDDNQDIAHHLRTIEVPAPGSMRRVLDLTTLVEALPFEPDRSPWDATLFHGLEDGGAVVYLRAHHVLTDGIGGVQLLRDLFDPQPGVADRAVAAGTIDLREGGAGGGGGAGAGSPGTITIDLSGAARTFAAGMEAARGLQPLDVVVRGLQRTLEVANSVSRQVLVTGGPLSPVPDAHSMLSHFDVFSVPGARQAASELGGSRNDVLVVAAAAALGLYYERRGQPCAEVRLAMPARQRREGDIGGSGNWFAPARVALPSSADHPARQFGIVRERLSQARHEPALRVTAAVASTLSLLPNRLLLPALNTQADSIDLSVTTLPGLRGKPTLCGVDVRTAYPFGPRLGIPLNITAFGSHSDLDIGIALDPAAITDPDGFRDCLVEAFDRLVPTSVAAAPTP